MKFICIVFLSFAVPQSFQPTEAERRAASLITQDVLRAHTRFLASDLLEGRGPGSRGDSLAQAYILSQLQALGLKPGARGGPEGGWLQPVPLVGVSTHQPREAVFLRTGERVSLKQHDDFIVSAGAPRPQLAFQDAEIVFVGYGIQAPEHGWDDFKGADVRGKVLLVLNNDPARDPRLFAGETRLYYGRWDYKYEKAAEVGAAAALIIHTTPSAGYPWQVVQTSWSGEQFELRSESARRLAAKGWLTEDAARRVVLLAGKDLDQLRQAAEGRDFRPVPLGVRLSLELASTIRDVTSANVLGVLEGSDPELKHEAVLVTAHHDHLGMEEIGPGAKGGAGAVGVDRIYNGAVDNASGVAVLLAMARAFTALPAAPSRSILFAAVAAEEQGLLGSAHLAAHPPFGAGHLAAIVNMDGINIWGRTRDVTFVGLGKSDLDLVVQAVAAWQGRVVKPDQFPDRGFFYRSDQFSLARIGVPGIYLDTGTDFIGRPAGWGKEQAEAWEREHYHQPSDEYSDSWDLSGAVEDAQLLFYAALRVAQARAMPRWTPGDEFEAARKAALEARGRP